MKPMRAVLTGLALVAVLAGAGCTAGTQAPREHRKAPQAPAPSSAAAPVSIRVMLPSRTMTAGSTMWGRAIVENNTGHAIRVASCGLPFTLALASSTYQPTIAWTTCAGTFTFRTGRSGYPLELLATYLACHPHRAPACLPGKGAPPLPAGRYQARLFFLKQFAPAPPPIRIIVTTK